MILEGPSSAKYLTTPLALPAVRFSTTRTPWNSLQANRWVQPSFPIPVKISPRPPAFETRNSPASDTIAWPMV